MINQAFWAVIVSKTEDKRKKMVPMNSSKVIKVLLVEHDASLTRRIRQLLRVDKRSIFDLEYADRFQDGLDRLSQREVDVVLLDLDLPDFKGPQMVNKIFAQAPAAALVLLAGESKSSEAAEIIQSGAQDYLLKDDIKESILSRVIRYAIDHKLRDEFIATVSHEMRTPLTIIREGASLIRDKVLGEVNARQEKMFDGILQNVDRLKVILNDLLDISKIKSGKNPA